MSQSAAEFFQSILETPSPSGYEGPVQKLVRDYVADAADDIYKDRHGNLVAVKNSGAPLRVMLAGHCDQIGLIVRYIDDDGFVFAQAIGGWDPVLLIGQRATIWGAAGAVSCVIGRKPIHLLTEEENKQVPKIKDVWLDLGATNKEDAASVVRVGDAVTVALGYREIRNRRAVSPAMDDKAGLWVVVEAFRRADRAKLNCALYLASTVQEELGYRGAQTSCYGIDPQIGVAVDVTHATDYPGLDKKEFGDVRLGKGPVIWRGANFHPTIVDRLMATANTHDIGYQRGAMGFPSFTDANMMQLSRAGVATGLVGIPLRYMHSPVEIISLDDIDRAADLLARFVESLPDDINLTP